LVGKEIEVTALPRVAIVGRPNVGKSTLFNRISGSRRAIVDSVAGSTRDRNVTRVEWAGKEFDLVDTGGILESVETPLDAQVAAQVQVAIDEADLVCWVVDGRSGVLPDEHFLASKLRPIAERVLLVVNKIDTDRLVPEAMEFHRLGFGTLFETSAEHGLGVRELLDEIAERLPAATAEPESEREIRVAIVGRPNVGKSSLLNRIAGEDRAVVSEMAGTTRDAVDTVIVLDAKQYRFVDTAGIRRRGKLSALADRLSVLYAERAIERAHLCLLVLDALAGVTTEDGAIGGKIADAGRGVVLVFNKWDLVEEREARAKELEREARDNLPHLDFAPIVFISAKSGRGVAGIYPRMERVREEQLRRIPTPELNRFLKDAAARVPARSKDGKEARLLYIVQSGVAPPRFVLFSNRAQSDLDPTYPRYLARRLREAYGFEGTPVRVLIRKRKSSKSQ
jgi:GTP-binding protein